MIRRIFFDASLIGVARALEAQDERIIYPGHPDWPLSQDAPDEDWLRYVGERGWCAILRDKRIRFRETQRAALETHRVRAVVIATSRNLSIDENVALLRRHWRGIEGALSGPPSYWHLTASGLKTMLEHERNLDPGDRGEDFAT